MSSCSDSEDSQKWSRLFPNHGENSINTETWSVSESDLSSRLQEILNDSLYANLDDGFLSRDSSIESMLKYSENGASDSSSLFSVGSLQSADLFGSETSNLNSDVFDTLPMSSSSVKDYNEQKVTESSLSALPVDLTNEKIKNWFSIISHEEYVYSKFVSCVDWSDNQEGHEQEELNNEYKLSDEQMSFSQNSTMASGNDSKHSFYNRLVVEENREDFVDDAKYEDKYAAADSPNPSTCSDLQPMDVTGNSDSNSPKQDLNTDCPPRYLDPDIIEVSDGGEPMDVTVISSDAGSIKEEKEVDDVQMRAFPMEGASPEHRLQDMLRNPAAISFSEYGKMLDAYLKAEEELAIGCPK